MNHTKTPRINRSFSLSVGDVQFKVTPNKLQVSNNSGVSLSTHVRKEEMEILQSFCEKASEILAPFPNTEVIYSIEDGPQKITLLVDEKENYMLIINDQIQFTSQSEEIYHEALVCPAIATQEVLPQTYLILGGGDGLAAKQIFRTNPDAHVVLVDFDENITRMFTEDEVLASFNEQAMSKCSVLNMDAFEFVQHHKDTYDVIICDFPDPDDEIFNKLYSLEFYEMLKPLLNRNGTIAVQSGSLAAESRCFQCIAETIKAAGFQTLTYYTPTTYGELVYTIGSLHKKPQVVFAGTKRQYNTISQEYFDKAMTTFRPGSYAIGDIVINTVENNAALEYRLRELKLV